MSCQILHRLILTAVVSVTALAAIAAPPKDIAPVPAEAVQAVRAAQQGRPDPMAEALDRHLRDDLDLPTAVSGMAQGSNRKVSKYLRFRPPSPATGPRPPPGGRKCSACATTSWPGSTGKRRR